MSEEYITDREEDLLVYLRNSLTDPDSRGSDATETFDGDDSTTEFTLSNTGVKNVGAVTVGGVSKYQGTDYTVAYGEGTDATVLTFLTAPPTGTDNVSITYHYGNTWIVREFARNDASVPRIILMQFDHNMEPSGVGNPYNGGQGAYLVMTHVIEVRSKYARQLRVLASQVLNQGVKMNHETPLLFRFVESWVANFQNLDWQEHRNAYVAQFRLTTRWFIQFKA